MCYGWESIVIYANITRHAAGHTHTHIHVGTPKRAHSHNMNICATQCVVWWWKFNFVSTKNWIKVELFGVYSRTLWRDRKGKLIYSFFFTFYDEHYELMLFLSI